MGGGELRGEFGGLGLAAGQGLCQFLFEGALALCAAGDLALEFLETAFGRGGLFARLGEGAFALGGGFPGGVALALDRGQPLVGGGEFALEFFLLGLQLFQLRRARGAGPFGFSFRLVILQELRFQVGDLLPRRLGGDLLDLQFGTLLPQRPHLLFLFAGQLLQGFEAFDALDQGRDVLRLAFELRALLLLELLDALLPLGQLTLEGLLLGCGIPLP